jgi:hypothetical protein
MALYSVNIKMDQVTMNALKAAGYSLYGFKSVKTSNNGGQPLVWFKTQDFLTETEVSWTEDYQAYISTSKLIPKGVIKSSTSKDVDIGQEMNVDNSGSCTVVNDGVEGAIAIQNQGNNQYVCGISQKQDDGSFNLLCGFPLYGQTLDTITPIEKVFFMFATDEVQTATVIAQSFATGLLIDLTGITNREVTYVINDGWDWGGESWGHEYPPKISLNTLLIEH